ncbi:MAG: N-acetylmuramoyl-L-alanine amidase [Arenicella sp.]|jgi:N-acetylmuramoyl-L-alanine amidase
MKIKFEVVRSIVLILLMGLTSFAFAKDNISILVDAGHGGSDPGHLPIQSSGLQEKVLTLAIAKKVGGYLQHNLGNVIVDFTREDDSYPSLDARVDQANSGKYDFMLSIHVNGNPNTAIHGTETLIHNYDAKDSHKWAKLIESQFKKRAGRHSRGVKTSADLGHSLQILKFTKIPTVIVECGFITNTTEASYLASVYGQEIIASAVFRATRDFIKYKFPDVNIDPPIVESEENEYVEVNVEGSANFKIQIMASIDPVDTDIPEFKKLGLMIERRLIETESSYKYRYFAGQFATKKEAKNALKDVQSNGFKDAFISAVK